jgi:hypothetical protein
MPTIAITCPACDSEIHLETEADQTCDAHDWHAHKGDRATCINCRFEWVVMPAGPFDPHNRHTHYNQPTVDRCNDVFLAVRMEHT